MRGSGSSSDVARLLLQHPCQDGRIPTIEDIYLHSLPIKEFQIIDNFFAPGVLKDEVLCRNQSDPVRFGYGSCMGRFVERFRFLVPMVPLCKGSFQYCLNRKGRFRFWFWFLLRFLKKTVPTVPVRASGLVSGPS